MTLMDCIERIPEKLKAIADREFMEADILKET